MVGGDPLAVGQVLCGRRVERHDVEQPPGDVGRSLERPGDVDVVVLEVDRVRHVERSDGRAAEGDEVGAGTERGPDVPGECADVGARRAVDDHVEVDHGHLGAVHRDRVVGPTGDVEARHGDRARAQHDLLALPREVVRPTAVDLDRADGRRHLVDDAPLGGDRPLDRVLRHVGAEDARHRCRRAVGVVRVRCHAEPDRRGVGLAETDQVREQPGRGTGAEEQEPRRHRVEGARVPDLLQPEPPSCDRDDPVAGDALRLVDEEDAVRRGSEHRTRVPAPPAPERARETASGPPVSAGVVPLATGMLRVGDVEHRGRGDLHVGTTLETAGLLLDPQRPAPEAPGARCEQPLSVHDQDALARTRRPERRDDVRAQDVRIGRRSGRGHRGDAVLLEARDQCGGDALEVGALLPVDADDGAVRPDLRDHLARDRSHRVGLLRCPACHAPTVGCRGERERSLPAVCGRRDRRDPPRPRHPARRLVPRRGAGPPLAPPRLPRVGHAGERDHAAADAGGAGGPPTGGVAHPLADPCGPRGVTPGGRGARLGPARLPAARPRAPRGRDGDRRAARQRRPARRRRPARTPRDRRLHRASGGGLRVRRPAPGRRRQRPPGARPLGPRPRRAGPREGQAGPAAHGVGAAGGPCRRRRDERRGDGARRARLRRPLPCVRRLPDRRPVRVAGGRLPRARRAAGPEAGAVRRERPAGAGPDHGRAAVERRAGAALRHRPRLARRRTAGACTHLAAPRRTGRRRRCGWVHAPECVNERVSED
ncbi:hypothetical protein Cus16_0204 [Curtobacterium sp. ER1/6]|nr:hypothetical protein Cus16_0204 [Curtobacterium sp. ER1/6]